MSTQLAIAWSLLFQSFHGASSGVAEVVRLRLCSRSTIIESSGDGSAQRGILGMGGVAGLCRFNIDYPQIFCGSKSMKGLKE